MRGVGGLAVEYKYLRIRRLALHIEESLSRGMRWVAIEPNGEPLFRAQMRLGIEAFLFAMFRQGAFQGATPRDAYFVKCDNTTTTLGDIDQGVVNILVGLAPLKPADFVVLGMQQATGRTDA